MCVGVCVCVCASREAHNGYAWLCYPDVPHVGKGMAVLP